MKWLLASALVIAVVAGFVAWPEAPRAPEPRVGSWASTESLCRRGVLVVRDRRGCESCAPVETRLRWSADGGELTYAGGSPTQLSRAAVSVILESLALLDVRESDGTRGLQDCLPGPPGVIFVTRSCDGFDGAVESAPDDVRSRFMARRCVESASVSALTCRLESYWAALRETSRHDRVETFVARLNALSVR